MQAAVFFNQFRRKPAVFVGQRQYLVPTGLNRAGLMRGNVPRIRRNYALIGSKRCRKNGEVCLRATHKKVDICTWRVAKITDDRCCFHAEFVFAITGRLYKVGFYEFFKNARVRTFAIVTIKAYHWHLQR